MLYVICNMERQTKSIVINGEKNLLTFTNNHIILSKHGQDNTRCLDHKCIGV